MVKRLPAESISEHRAKMTAWWRLKTSKLKASSWLRQSLSILVELFWIEDSSSKTKKREGKLIIATTIEKFVKVAIHPFRALQTISLRVARGISDQRQEKILLDQNRDTPQTCNKILLDSPYLRNCHKSYKIKESKISKLLNSQSCYNQSKINKLRTLTTVAKYC